MPKYSVFGYQILNYTKIFFLISRVGRRSEPLRDCCHTVNSKNFTQLLPFLLFIWNYFYKLSPGCGVPKVCATGTRNYPRWTKLPYVKRLYHCLMTRIYPLVASWLR